MVFSLKMGKVPFILLIISGYFVSKSSGARCDSEFYDSVSDCSSHPLRIGYFGSTSCGNLHTLTDSDGLPNANFARLNHPATFTTGSGTQYDEYVAGTYLSIKLSRPAHLFGIAMQGSPDSLRYYLKSFELWYKINVHDTDISKPVNVSEGFYKENGVIRRFSAEMRYTVNFSFLNPLYADEVRIYPILFYGKRVFRTELYGCYLGKIMVPASIGVNIAATVTVKEVQNVNSFGNRYYLKINEPDTTSSLISINGSKNYTFTSRGIGSIELGLNYSNGWISTYRTSFIVQGAILSLQLFLDGSSVVPYKKIENIDIEFRLLTTDQVYQIKKYLFTFGDTQTCNHNYCKKRYSRGIYNATGTASNDFYQSSIQSQVIACPNGPVAVTYNPAIHLGGIGISFLGSAVIHNFTVRFYALASTSYEVWINGSKTQTNTLTASGFVVRKISLPAGVVAPSQHDLIFNYTDACETRSYAATVYVDQVITGVSHRLNQTLKETLAVPYYFKNQPISFHVDIISGTTVQCEVSLQPYGGAKTWYTATKVSSRLFLYTHTLTTPGTQYYKVSGKCWNRLNVGDAFSVETDIEVREIPEQMSNFSLALSKQIVSVHENFYLYLIFLKGNQMNCSISSTSAGISQILTYNQLIAYQQSYSNSRKAYRLTISTSVFSLTHRIDVVCRNVWKEFKDNVTFQAQVPLSALSIDANSFACFNTSLNVTSTVSLGAPIHTALFVNSVQHLVYSSINNSVSSFLLTPNMYNTPGWTDIYVRAWNNVSNVVSPNKTIRIAETIQSLAVHMNFTLSSPQGLPDRPSFVLPTNRLVNFTAFVSPNSSGFVYNWSVNGTTEQHNVSNWFYIFPTPGQYTFKLTVNGCNSVVYEKSLRVVSPIEDFSVYFSPSPEVVVNKSVTISITNAEQSECVKLDFGDLSTPVTRCYINVNCLTNDIACTKDTHIYSRPGNYTIKMTASNALYAKFKEVLLVAKTCYNPSIRVKGDGTDMTGAIYGDEIVTAIQNRTRSSYLFYNITTVNVNCEFSENYSVSWRVYSAGLNPNGTLKMWNDPSFLMQNNAFTFSKDNHTAFIPCCIVKYGLLSVSIKVSVIGHNNTVGFEKNSVLSLLITQADLVALLAEKNHKEYSYNSTIILDGSSSYDPDKYSNDLKFTWYCRDTVLEPRKISAISNISLIDPGFANESEHTAVGCFGKSVGRINVGKNITKLSFNSMKLQENHTIEFTLVVEGTNPYGVRRSNVSRTVLVRMQQTPYFSLRCSENCAAKLDPTAKFSLLVDCKAPSCSNAVFRWTLVQNAMNHDIPTSLKSILYSKDYERDLYMKPGGLTAGLKYTLQPQAIGSDGAMFTQKYILRVNTAPVNGSCIIDPEQGMAIFSNFNINCTGWKDTELPLLYEVAHLTDLLTTVVCRQSHSSCQTMLPVGENGNSSLRIRIRIYDSLYMFTELYYTVRVTKPTVTEHILNNFLSTIENSSASQKTAQFIGSVASVLNTNEDRNKSLVDISIKIRDASMILLSRMVNSSSDDVIAPLIAMLATVPREFTQSSGIIATNTIVTLTSNLVRNQSTVIFRDLVSRSKSLLAAMGMVMTSTSSNLDPNRNVKNESNFTENPLKWKMADGRSIVLSTTAALQSLVNAVFSRMSSVEDPIEILTANLGMSLRKIPGYKMENTTTQKVMGGEISVPPLNKIGVNSSLIISSLMMLTTFNNYFWASNSKVIKSSLINYSLRSDKQILSVKDTVEPVQLYIPRTNIAQSDFQHWLFQERLNEKRVNYHKLKVEHDNCFHIEFKPMNYCSDYHIYIKYNTRPSKLNYDRNWTLPDLSSCNQTGLQDVIRANICSTYQDLVNSSLSNQYNGSKAIFNCTLKILLEAKIKEITSHCLSDPYRIFMSDAETRNGTYYFGIYDFQGPLSTRSSPAVLFNSSRQFQVSDYKTEKSYYLRSYTSKCRFWDATKAENWQTYGCQVAKMTNISMVHCQCSHLTTFASDFFIPPNPIDFDKVIAGFKNIKDNLSVVILISVLIGVFVMLLVYLRKADQKDVDKVGVIVIDDDHSKPYEYLIITVTGARTNAGTTANVFCSLNTSTKIGEPRLLYDPEKVAFQRDQINAFKISFDEPIGQLTDMRIWHDNQGKNPGWYLSRVYVEDLQTNQTYSFICEQWLAVELEDGLIDRTLGLAGSEDYEVFTHIFTTKAAEDFSDQHLWLSVFLKRPHDTFTRVQRASCCMALLCTTMVTSAMFFQLGNASKYLWRIGSLVIDYKGIIIGIQSGLIVIPVNAAIIALFRNTESFDSYRKRTEKRIAYSKTGKRKKFFPFGFIFVGWFLVVAAVVSSLVVVLFYSMQWGNEKSKQFVLSVFTGFFQSAFIIQPLKLLAVALILAVIFKKSSDETDVLDIYKYSENEKHVIECSSRIDMPLMHAMPLTKDQLEYARKRRLMEVRLRLFLQDFISYLIFLVFLAFVVVGYRDPDAYNFNKALTDDVIHEHFDNIQDVPGLWSWVQNHFIPAIYSQSWYNGDNFTNHKMLRNQEAFRIGLSRLRQLRVKPGTCKLDEDVIGLMRGCNDFYSLELNEEKDFDVAWKPLGTARKKRAIFDNYDDDVVRWKTFPGDDSSEEKDWNEDVRMEEDELSSYESLESDANFHENDSVKPGTGTAVSEINEDKNNGPVNVSHHGTVHKSHGIFKQQLDHELKILKRLRRALKFKIKRKTIPSSSLKSHSNEIIIDSQYLLPDGSVRPNKQHWKYNQASKLRGFPYFGKFALYSGGGYVASLATDIDYARAVAMALEQDSWIDSLTRAVFFEFSVYNANMNFFATGFIIVEVLPTGSIIPSPGVRVFRLYRYVGAFGKLIMASEIILVLAMLFFMYKECRHLYRIGRIYFKQFWSWVEITISVSLFAALILRGFSWYEADKILTLLSKDPNRFINFQYVVLADDSLLLAVAVICFASTLKILKLISIFPTVVALKETLSLCGKPLLNYAIPFTVLFSGFAAFGNLVFWNSEWFSTYLKTVQTQMLMLIGGSVFSTLREANWVYGPIYFLFFAAFETVVFMNVFVAILNEGIEESFKNKQNKAASIEFMKYVEARFFALFNLSAKNAEKKGEKKRKMSRRETLMMQRKSTVNRSKCESQFVALKKKKTAERKLTLAIEHWDSVLFRLEEKVDKYKVECRTEYKEVSELYLRLAFSEQSVVETAF